MSRKMTVVFHDEELYTDLKVEAARRHKTASEIVAEAVQEWLDAREDEAILPMLEARLREAEEKGTRPWEEVKREWEEELTKRERLSMVAEKRDV